MHTIQPNIEDVSSALRSARGRLARIDLDALQQSATSFARDAIPAFAPPRRRRRRWPIVGGFVVLAVAVLGILYMSPLIRRQTESKEDDLETDRTHTPDGHQADARQPEVDSERDASDVVTGPVGSASLRDPSSAPDEGADLEQLPGVQLYER